MTAFARPQPSLRGPTSYFTLARSIAGIVMAAAVYAAFHPYTGLIGDASLYLGHSLADLDPGGVGRDIVFAYDGQTQFSIFPRILDVLVAAIGVARASMLVAVAASVCVFSATLVLARALTGDRRLVLAVVLVAATMPAAYGDAVFRFAETSAVPRPFAEAAVLAMLAALLAGRPFLAGLCLLLALILHPIMAMAGVGTALVLFAWRRSARASLIILAFLATGAGLAVLLGAMGVPLFDRLVARVDRDWLGMLTERGPHLFPSLWHTTAFAAPILQSTTIALTVWRGASGRRRVLVAVVVSAFVQLAVAALLGDTMHDLLVIQLQSWRALWLLAFIGTLCLPIVVFNLWNDGAKARVVLALLGLAWLGPAGVLATFVICCAMLALHAKPTAFPIENKHAIWALITVGGVAIVNAAMTFAGWVGFVRGVPPGVTIGFFVALQSGLLITPAWLAIAIWLLSQHRSSRLNLAALGIAALAFSTIAAWTWDQRTSAALTGRQDNFPQSGIVPGARSSEVLVLGGVASAWFELGRPQYLSPEQAVSIVFSRPLAMEWRRRALALAALGLVPHTMFRPWDLLDADDHIVVTPAKLSALCQRSDAPAAVIIPDRDDAPAPALTGATRWTASPPQQIIYNSQTPQWHTVRGWVVAPCSALHERDALAKSPER